MNLKLARELLVAADEQPYGFLRVAGREETREVELLAQDGYVEASVQPGAASPKAVINRLTPAGEKLLRVLRQETNSPAFPREMEVEAAQEAIW